MIQRIIRWLKALFTRRQSFKTYAGNNRLKGGKPNPDSAWLHSRWWHIFGEHHHNVKEAKE